jgi:hypothetical protein
MGTVSLARAALSIALAALAAGCAPVTEIFACYGVAPELNQPRGVLRVRAQALDGTLPLYESDIGTLLTTFASQGFVQERQDGIHITLEASIPETGGDRIVRQEARVTFQRDRIVEVSLLIEEACRTAFCGAETTCVGGVCLPLDIDPACLADRGGTPPRSCTDERVRRGCDAP